MSGNATNQDLRINSVLPTIRPEFVCRFTPPFWASRGIISVAYNRVLILHDQPLSAPFHYNEGLDTSFILVPDPIRSSEWARPANDRPNSQIRTGQPHRNVFNS